jgi:hypothetical protein
MNDQAGWPERADCARPGCGHSSDVHVFASLVPLLRLTVTESAAAWPCERCDCPTMLRSPENYRAMTGLGS